MRVSVPPQASPSWVRVVLGEAMETLRGGLESQGITRERALGKVGTLGLLCDPGQVPCPLGCFILGLGSDGSQGLQSEGGMGVPEQPGGARLGLLSCSELGPWGWGLAWAGARP